LNLISQWDWHKVNTVLIPCLTQCLFRVNATNWLGARFENIKLVYTPANLISTQSQDLHRVRELTECRIAGAVCTLNRNIKFCFHILIYKRNLKRTIRLSGHKSTLSNTGKYDSFMWRADLDKPVRLADPNVATLPSSATPLVTLDRIYRNRWSDSISKY